MGTFQRPIKSEQVRFLRGSLSYIIAYLKTIKCMKFSTCITTLNSFTLILRTRKNGQLVNRLRSEFIDGKLKIKKQNLALTQSLNYEILRNKANLIQSGITSFSKSKQGLVHTTPEFERLGPPFTLIRYQNGAFRKSSSNRWNLKTSAFHFRVSGKHFKNGRTFRKR